MGHILSKREIDRWGSFPDTFLLNPATVKESHEALRDLLALAEVQICELKEEIERLKKPQEPDRRYDLHDQILAAKTAKEAHSKFIKDVEQDGGVTRVTVNGQALKDYLKTAPLPCDHEWELIQAYRDPKEPAQQAVTCKLCGAEEFA